MASGKVAGGGCWLLVDWLAASQLPAVIDGKLVGGKVAGGD